MIRKRKISLIFSCIVTSPLLVRFGTFRGLQIVWRNRRFIDFCDELTWIEDHIVFLLQACGKGALSPLTFEFLVLIYWFFELWCVIIWICLRETDRLLEERRRLVVRVTQLRVECITLAFQRSECLLMRQLALHILMHLPDRANEGLSRPGRATGSLSC